MDHWFDRLARGLARETPSRRAMLRAAFSASLGVAGAAALRRFGGAARSVSAADDDGPPPVRACNICQEGQPERGPGRSERKG